VDEDCETEKVIYSSHAFESLTDELGTTNLIL